MKKLTYRIKIIIIASALAVFLLAMFLYGFGVMAGRNESIKNTLAQKNIELEILKREQQSFEQGLKDLAELEKASYPPEGLFSNDIHLVSQIQQLEAEAKIYGLAMTIAISGSTETAIKLKNTKNELFSIPYTVTLQGGFDDTLKFIQAMEQLPFVTHVNGISVKTSSTEDPTTIIKADFFIKK